MFNTNPFRQHRAKVEVLSEDPAHYAAIARNNAAKQAERDKADPEAAKKRKKASAAINKKFTKNPVKPADIGRHSSSFIGRRNESTTYVIPEEIPANERTAFHGAAAAAAKQNKKSFEFGGKTHPVTMKKDLAKKIADQKEGKQSNPDNYEPFKKKKKEKKESVKKESTMSFREKLVSILEGDRASHYKSATTPEGMLDKSQSSKGAMDMTKGAQDKIKSGSADLDVKKSLEANEKDKADKKMKQAKKRSGGDNVASGDQNIKPSATPIKDPTAKMEGVERHDKYGIFGKTMNELLDAVTKVTNKKD